MRTTSTFPDTAAYLPTSMAGNVGYLLARLGSISLAAFSDSLQPIGLRPRHYAVLSALVDNPDLATQHAVGGCLAIDPSTMVAVVDDLENQGLVRRHRDPADRRRYRLAVTSKGQQKHKACRAVADRIEAELLGGLGDDERATLRRLLQQALRVAER